MNSVGLNAKQHVHRVCVVYQQRKKCNRREKEGDHETAHSDEIANEGEQFKRKEVKKQRTSWGHANSSLVVRLVSCHRPSLLTSHYVGKQKLQIEIVFFSLSCYSPLSLSAMCSTATEPSKCHSIVASLHNLVGKRTNACKA